MGLCASQLSVGAGGKASLPSVMVRSDRRPALPERAARVQIRADAADLPGMRNPQKFKQPDLTRPCPLSSNFSRALVGHFRLRGCVRACSFLRARAPIKASSSPTVCAPQTVRPFVRMRMHAAPRVLLSPLTCRSMAHRLCVCVSLCRALVGCVVAWCRVQSAGLRSAVRATRLGLHRLRYASASASL